MLEKIMIDLRTELNKQIEESDYHLIKMRENELKILDIKDTLAYLEKILEEKKLINKEIK